MFTVTAWLKRRTPPPGPPAPGHVDHATLMAQIAEKERLRITTPALAFLKEQAPPEQRDKWGEPLPLSEYEQERLDQMVAIMAAPEERGRALIQAGMITPAEVDALVRVYPDVLSVLEQEVIDDMLDNPPPYPAWSETTLGVFFGMPAADVYGAGTPSPPDRSQSLQGAQKKATEAEVPSTPSERREVAVREMRS